MAKLFMIPDVFSLVSIILLGLVVITMFFRFLKKKTKAKKLIREHQEYKDALNSLDIKIVQNEIILESIPDIIYLIDNDGVFVSVITKNDDLLFKPKEELIDTKIENSLPSQVGEQFTNAIKTVSKTGKIETIFFNFSVDGIEKNFAAHFVPYEDDKLLCVVRDKTKEEKYKQDLKNTINELKESIKSKDRFFSIIAHDLKNPFNALIGFSSLLNEDFSEFEDDERLEYIQQIHQASEGLFTLLENLLEWSKAKTGEVEFNPEEVDIHSVIENNIDILMPEARQKNIRVDFQNDIDLETKVFADKNMLTSIIRNLTANAIKFTYPEGQIIISTKFKNGFVECSVKDDGIGISDEDQKKLFKIDENLKKSGTQNETGTGLGLLLCKEFVEKQGGQIYVESKTKAGSKFSFTVPKA